MPLKAILGEVKHKWGVDVNNCQLYRARRIAKKMFQGKVKLQYNKLWDYCETIRQANRGSCVMMKVDRPLPDHPACFQRLYFSLAAMKKGFRAGCRPIIELNRCFLKGTYKGQLLSAISTDDNNNMYPVALVVVEAKTKDSWIWFLETLVSDLGTPPAQGWTFISDRQKGLQPAFDVVLPRGDHRFCVRHLYANYRDAGHRGLALKDKLWAAAAAYTEAEFHKEIDELKHISEDAYNYLSNVDPSLWSRAWFNIFPRCDLLVNNLCECFNAYILNARDLPIISMLEFIRKKLMKRDQVKKDGIRTMTGRLCPRVVAKLDEIGQWDMTGIPCAYAMSAIWFFNANPKDYVDDWYTIEMYKKAYDDIVYPMPGEDQWVKTNYDQVDPLEVEYNQGGPEK
ncbi:uncharacterized protein LOC132168246 [Corylus avellana]|uniref:uncharacterized protein LOC132168246 n=1 Tax=Corylus avellana TaxID=13451 RepID=UPI00286A8E02|nr:uncharacterized protein LOC132168246 [Corylus avellana]